MMKLFPLACGQAGNQSNYSYPYKALNHWVWTFKEYGFLDQYGAPCNSTWDMTVTN
jgi:hypothetical protein